jgi:hypothetical protein
MFITIWDGRLYLPLFVFMRILSFMWKLLERKRRRPAVAAAAAAIGGMREIDGRPVADRQKGQHIKRKWSG